MPDLISIFTNLSKSLAPIQELLTGFGYILGIALVFLALHRFHKIGGASPQSHSQEKMFVPVLYLIMGAGLIFLPSSFDVLANTAFGSGNVLSYSGESDDGSFDPSLIAAIKLLIETTGVLWFVRGSSLLAQSSQPGVQEGSKGVTFIVAGVLAMNFDNTVQTLDYTLSSFFTYMSSLKSNATG